MKRLLIAFTLMTSTLTAFADGSSYEDLAKAQRAKISPEAQKVIDESIQKIRENHLAEKALKVGQKMPDFSLKDENGNNVKLVDVRKVGPVIVTFYRGSWCPFCSLQLHLYQERLADFKARGATLLAITPEKPDLALLMKSEKKLEFPVLTDTDNKLATKFGLVWAVDKNLEALSRKAGIDLTKSQGNPDWKLPVPATFVIDQQGRIIYAFVNADWSKRAEPADILSALDSLKTSGKR